MYFEFFFLLLIVKGWKKEFEVVNFYWEKRKNNGEEINEMIKCGILVYINIMCFN